MQPLPGPPCNRQGLPTWSRPRRDSPAKRGRACAVSKHTLHYSGASAAAAGSLLQQLPHRGVVICMHLSRPQESRSCCKALTRTVHKATQRTRSWLCDWLRILSRRAAGEEATYKHRSPVLFFRRMNRPNLEQLRRKHYSGAATAIIRQDQGNCSPRRRQ